MGRILAVALLCAGVGFTFLSPALIAQRGRQGGVAPAAPASTKPIPRLADGKPDLSGTWGAASLDMRTFSFEIEERAADRRAAMLKAPPPESLEAMYQPAAFEKLKTFQDKDDPVLKCYPFGVPRGMQMTGPHLMQVVHTPGQVVVLYEYFHSFRIIPTDGRPHPDDIFPTYYGDSVAKWESDTLVVDVTGFNDKTWLGGQGTFHSEDLRVVERWALADADTLEYQVTIEDPKVLKGPWTGPKRRIRRAPADRRIVEAMCLDTTSATLMEGAQPEPRK